MNVPSLLEIVTRVATSGAVGGVIAFLFERIEWFQKLKPKAKWGTILGLSLGLPVLAQVAIQHVPPEVWEILDPYWRSLAYGFLVWLGSQVAHMWHKKQG